MLARGIEVAVVLYMLVILGSSRKWINVLRVCSNHRAPPLIGSGGTATSTTEWSPSLPELQRDTHVHLKVCFANVEHYMQ